MQKNRILFICILIGIVSGISITINYARHKNYIICQNAREKHLEIYNMLQQAELAISDPNNTNNNFAQISQNGGMYKCKVRSKDELQIDMAASLKDSEIELTKLELEPGQNIPYANSEKSVFWEGTLAINQAYTPKDEEIFQTQNWVANFSSKKNIEIAFKNWKDNQVKNGVIGIILLTQTQLSPNLIQVKFQTGMMPGMRMPHRILPPIPENFLSIKNTYLPISDNIPEFISQKNCIVSNISKLENIHQKSTEPNSILKRMEVNDRTVWVKNAAIKVQTFLEQSKLSLK